MDEVGEWVEEPLNLMIDSHECVKREKLNDCGARLKLKKWRMVLTLFLFCSRNKYQVGFWIENWKLISLFHCH